MFLQVTGVALLIGHAVHAALAATRRPDATLALATKVGDGGWVRRLLVMSLGNPASWLDTLVMLGSVGAAMPASASVTFSVGAFVTSIARCTAWVSLARGASHWLTSSRNWQIVDVATAIAMLGMAFWLATDLIARL